VAGIGLFPFLSNSFFPPFTGDWLKSNSRSSPKSKFSPESAQLAFRNGYAKITIHVPKCRGDHLSLFIFFVDEFNQSQRYCNGIKARFHFWKAFGLTKWKWGYNHEEQWGVRHFRRDSLPKAKKHAEAKSEFSIKFDWWKYSFDWLGNLRRYFEFFGMNIRQIVSADLEPAAKSWSFQWWSWSMSFWGQKIASGNINRTVIHRQRLEKSNCTTLHQKALSSINWTPKKLLSLLKINYIRNIPMDAAEWRGVWLWGRAFRKFHSKYGSWVALFPCKYEKPIMMTLIAAPGTSPPPPFFGGGLRTHQIEAGTAGKPSIRWSYFEALDFEVEFGKGVVT